MSVSASDLSAAELRVWLIARIAQHLECDSHEIELHTPLIDYGLDSIFSVSLCGELEDLLQRDVDPTLLWDHPSITAIVAHLSSG